MKKFDAWCHLTVMLYAVISRFDSLREIISATMMECRKLQHLGIKDLPRRSTLSDANSRRDEKIFRNIDMDLYHGKGKERDTFSRGFRYVLSGLQIRSLGGSDTSSLGFGS